MTTTNITKATPAILTLGLWLASKEILEARLHFSKSIRIGKPPPTAEEERELREQIVNMLIEQAIAAEVA